MRFPNVHIYLKLSSLYPVAQFHFTYFLFAVPPCVQNSHQAVA
jgi:hypothetical protein